MGGNRSETAASVDADIGRLRGWSYAAGNENVAGSVLDGLSLRVGSQATFGWIDPITVTSIVPTVLDLVREINAGRPGGGPEGSRKAMGAFGPFSASVAGAAFKQAVKSA